MNTSCDKKLRKIINHPPTPPELPQNIASCSPMVQEFIEKLAPPIRKNLPAYVTKTIFHLRKNEIHISCALLDEPSQAHNSEIQKICERFCSQIPIFIHLYKHDSVACKQNNHQSSIENRIRDEFTGTDIEPRKIHLYSAKLEKGKLQYVSLSAYVPHSAQNEFQEKIDKLQKEIGVFIFCHFDQVPDQLDKELSRIANGRGYLDSTDLPKIQKKIEWIHGAPLPKRKDINIPEMPFEKAKDLTSIPFITIDNDETNNLEDGLYAKEIENGDIQLMVAICDCAWLVKRGSKIDKVARLAGHSLWADRARCPIIHDDFACNELSLLPHEKRLAWVYNLCISPFGVIKLAQSSLTYAIVKSNGRYSPARLHEIPEDILIPLSKSTLRLSSRLSKKVTFERFSQLTDGEQIVAMAMINVNGNLPYFARRELHKLGHRGPLPFVFRNNQKLDFHAILQLRRKIRRIGLNVDISDFRSPSGILELWETLLERDELKILNEMTRLIELRSSYGPWPMGFVPLNQKEYVHSKYRNYDGLKIQQALWDIFIEHNPNPPESDELLRTKIADRLNRKMRAYGANCRKLSELAMIERRLKHEGEKFTAHIAKVKEGEVLISIPELEPESESTWWGVLVSNNGYLESLKIDDTVMCKLKHYRVSDRKNRRFVFELVQE